MALSRGYAESVRLARETFAWHKTTLTRFQTDPAHDVYANSATSISRCRIGNRVFFGSVSKRQLWRPRSSSCSQLLRSPGIGFIPIAVRPLHQPRWPSANSAQEYEQVIARYPNTPAGADAYILLAEAQRKERKFTDANKTLETFIAKYPKHELVSTAKMAMAANLDSMGKTDEALAMYQQIASAYPNSYAAPLAMLSQVYILKPKNRNDDARRICETILTQYRTSFWAGEAMQQLRLLKPITTSTAPPAAVPAIPPMLAVPAAPAPQAPPAPNQPQSAPSPKKP
jgi:tetratricopeptide (TPR) repeat protein